MSCFSVFWLLAQCLQKIFSGNFCLHILDTYSVLWELVRTGNTVQYSTVKYSTVDSSTHNLRWLSRAGVRPRKKLLLYL